MAMEADNEGDNIFMSVEDIAEHTSLTVRGTQKTLKTLKEKGRVGVRTEAIHHTPATYYLNLSQFKGKKKPVKTNEEINKYLELTWQSYPPDRRVGKSKTFNAILKAYKKISPEELLQKVRDYANAMHRREQYAPHSYRWFEHERYLDDPKTWNASRN